MCGENGDDAVICQPLPTGREEDIIDVGKCDYDNIAPFCSVYNTPPAKVRSSISELGIGIFCEIDKESGNYVYEFRNGRLYDKTDKTQYKNLHFLLFYFLNYSHDPLNVILYQLESDSNWKQYIGAYR